MASAALKKISVSFFLVLLFLSHSSHADFINPEQEALNSLIGNWHSVQGYVLHDMNSSCFTTQPFSLFLAGPSAAHFSYSFSCSTGYQAQMQSLDFSPSYGTYQNGYNTVTSKFLFDMNNTIAGFERKVMTTWGFGSMINYQYQTVRVTVTSRLPSGIPEALSFNLINSQSNVQNGQETTYHLDLVRN